MDATCESYRHDLSALLDGQLNPKEQTDIQGHLNDCENCSDELETLKKLTKFLAEQMQPEILETPDIWAAMQDSLPSVCDVMKEDLSAYLDGELTPAAQEGVNKHLKECSLCLVEFKRLNEANRLLSKGLELPASVKVDLWPAVKAQLNEDCALIRSELSAYADQEVVNQRHRNITTHLTDCAECRDEFSNVSRIGDLIRDSYKPAMADDFDLWPGIRDKMQVVPFAPKAANAAASSSANNKAVQPQKQRWVVGAMAAVIVAAIGIVITVAPQAQSETISSESYLIESALAEPSDTNVEAAVYER